MCVYGRSKERTGVRQILRAAEAVGMKLSKKKLTNPTAIHGTLD